MRKSLVFIVLLSLSLSTFGQHVYPVIYDNCYLDQFEFERDKILVPQEEDRIIEVVTTGWEDKMLKKAEGTLGLQILIDNRGRSCLMSVGNDTNLKLKKMNLEENINNGLRWKTLSTKISVLILLVFDKEKIKVKRLGTADMINLIELDN